MLAAGGNLGRHEGGGAADRLLGGVGETGHVTIFRIPIGMSGR